MILNVTIKTGTAGYSVGQVVAGAIFTAASTNNIKSLKKTLSKYGTKESTIRIDFNNGSESILSAGGRGYGETISFNINLLVSIEELIFNLSEYAVGNNRSIIGHGLSINGEFKWFKPYDKRIIKILSDDKNLVTGIDIVEHDLDKDEVGIKSFMEKDIFCCITNTQDLTDLQGIDKFKSTIGLWLLVKSIVDKQRLSYPDYSIANLVRKAMGSKIILPENETA